jgi:hypothetical protein
VLAALALLGLPNTSLLLLAAALLWILDASLNISMEPFRAFVGDMTREDQRAQGYAVQTMFIGTGMDSDAFGRTKCGRSRRAPFGPIFFLFRGSGHLPCGFMDGADNAGIFTARAAQI